MQFFLEMDISAHGVSSATIKAGYFGIDNKLEDRAMMVDLGTAYDFAGYW